MVGSQCPFFIFLLIFRSFAEASRKEVAARAEATLTKTSNALLSLRCQQAPIACWQPSPSPCLLRIRSTTPATFITCTLHHALSIFFVSSVFSFFSSLPFPISFPHSFFLSLPHHFCFSYHLYFLSPSFCPSSYSFPPFLLLYQPFFYFIYSFLSQCDLFFSPSSPSSLKRQRWRRKKNNDDDRYRN